MNSKPSAAAVKVLTVLAGICSTLFCTAVLSGAGYLFFLDMTHPHGKGQGLWFLMLVPAVPFLVGGIGCIRNRPSFLGIQSAGSALVILITSLFTGGHLSQFFKHTFEGSILGSTLFI